MRSAHLLVIATLSAPGLFACADEDANEAGDSVDQGADAATEDGAAPTDSVEQRGDGEDADHVDITLNFAAVVGEQPLDCTSTYPAALAGFTFALSDLRLFVSEISLLDDDGNLYPLALDNGTEWQNDGVALLDFENGVGSCSNATAATNTTITGSAAPGDFTGIVFTVGVPEALNHVNPVEQTGPLANTALHWSWMMGYKHFQLEGSLNESGLVLLHLGSKDCVGNPPSDFVCSISNRPRVEITGANPASTDIVLDLAALLAGSIPVDNEVFCMAEQSDTCSGLLGNLGVDMASGDTISGTESRVFRFAQ
jgi:uncharacterized repeat protein (TIGR04052 family)